MATPKRRSAAGQAVMQEVESWVGKINEAGATWEAISKLEEAYLAKRAELEAHYEEQVVDAIAEAGPRLVEKGLAPYDITVPKRLITAGNRLANERDKAAKARRTPTAKSAPEPAPVEVPAEAVEASASE
jgi:hypothetical protein